MADNDMEAGTTTTASQQTTTLTTEPAPTNTSTTSPPAPIIVLRAPRKYNVKAPSAWSAPSLTWLQRTWTVTHSTLPMWRKAKNVRITYRILEEEEEWKPQRLDDVVESEPTEKTWMPQPKSIHGIDTPDGEAAWKWRGTGWLRVASSRWEVLGWGEDEEDGNGERECWVVTWFAASMFTPMGLDVYSSRKGGISAGLYARVKEALEGLGEGAEEVAELCKTEMREVKIE